MDPGLPRSELEEELLRNVVRGSWLNVIELYRRDPSTHLCKINKSCDTALHVAIASGLNSIVQKLVLLIAEAEAKVFGLRYERALEIRNDRGNTPLHVAVTIGTAPMCFRIAKLNPKLVALRNDNGETPLFLAALHGRTTVFLGLLSIYSTLVDGQCAYWRRKNGDTILHAVISGDHFDIAFYIVCLFEKIAHAVNEDGVSPLHLLANKPSAFKSGSHITGLLKLVYLGLPVSKLNPKSINWEGRKLPVNHKPKAEQYEEEEETNQQPTPGATYHTPRPSEARGEFERCWHFCMFIIQCLVDIITSVFKLVGNILDKLYEKSIIGKLRLERKKHIWSVQVMEKLLTCISECTSNLHHGMDSEYMGIRIPRPDNHEFPDSIEFSTLVTSTTWMEAPLLLAARNGVVEIVEGILDFDPGAVYQVTADEEKNIVMLAAQYRQPLLYKFLLQNPTIMNTLVHQTDKDGNTVLHIAANLGDHLPWRIRGAALQMHMEAKWYEFVKKSIHVREFFHQHNKESKTPEMIFMASHEKLLEEGRQWLTSNAQSCSVVGALIATVAFSTSATVPGGINQETGTPTLENETVFLISAFSSLIALGFSMISVVMFLSILTSSFQIKDFRRFLPRKLLLGLITLFVSIVSMLVSFASGHFFVLKDKLKYGAFPVYSVFCISVILITIAHFPLDFDTVWAILLKKEPGQSQIGMAMGPGETQTRPRPNPFGAGPDPLNGFGAGLGSGIRPEQVWVG